MSQLQTHFIRQCPSAGRCQSHVTHGILRLNGDSLSGWWGSVSIAGIIMLAHVFVVVSCIGFMVPVLCFLIALDHIHLHTMYVGCQGEGVRWEKGVHQFLWCLPYHLPAVLQSPSLYLMLKRDFESVPSVIVQELEFFTFNTKMHKASGPK